jgi:hypothetical protein
MFPPISELNSILAVNCMKAVSTNGWQKLILWLVVLLPGLFAYAHINYLIPRVTPNCLAHDYQTIIPVVVKMSTPGYNWANFIVDTSVGPHCLAPSVLLHFAMAHLTDWNAHTELYFGTFLIFIRCLFLADCVRADEGNWSKLLFLSSLLALNFGTACTSTLLFGNPCTSAGVGLLGFALGLWSIVRLQKHSILSSALVLLGGIASAGFGKLPTLMTWGLYLFASVLMRRRGRLHYACLILGCFLNCALVMAMPASNNEGSIQWHPVVLTNVLGRSFANNIGYSSQPMRQCEFVCYVGLAFLLILSLSLWKRKISIVPLIVPITLTIYGIVGALAISFSRLFIASWYSQFAVLFWSGILGAASVLLFSKPKALRYTFVALTPFAFTIVLYLQTNLDYKDKDFYRRVHSPVSESVMRHFDIAPTFAESAIFALDIGDVDQIGLMAEPLLQRQWSIFAKRQTWRLQGDYLLPLVTVLELPDKPRNVWIAGRNAQQRGSFRDPEHLNVCIADGNSVSWIVDVPQYIDEMMLETAVALETSSGQRKDNTANCSLTINEYMKGDRNKRLTQDYPLLDSFTSISTSLKQFAGKRIEIVFSGAPPGSGILAVFKEPLVKLVLNKQYKSVDSTRTLRTPLALIPCNTETSKYFPKLTADDFVFRPSFEDNWHVKGLSVSAKDKDGTPVYQAFGHELPVIEINLGDWTQRPVTFPRLGDFSNICVELAKPASDSNRLICIQLLFRDSRTAQIVMPIKKDGDFHLYSYETRLFEQEPDCKITGIQVFPTYLHNSGTAKIRSIRLIKKTICNK